MKGNDQMLEVLNALLADELTAINQYMVHAEMCESWGYQKLHQSIRHQAMEEMHHAEWLIERIIFFEGVPTVARLNRIRIGKTVLEMIINDNADEVNAVRSYNSAISLARETEDQATVDLLTRILKMEEGHVDWAEKQLAQINQMGIENYLLLQTETLTGVNH
ncbi:MAG: bacterioferritin [Candidatus Saccharibacteria bacterium]